MGLEQNVNFIEDMDSNNPDGENDKVLQGDDHLRLIKVAVQGSFPNLGQTAVTKTGVELNDTITASTTDVLTNKTIDNGIYTGTQTGFVGDITGNVTGNADTVTTVATDGVDTLAIQDNAVTLAKMADNSVSFASEIVNDSTDGTVASASATVVFPIVGVVNLQITASGTNATSIIEIQVGDGIWAEVGRSTTDDISDLTLEDGVQVISDGTNVRTSAIGGAYTLTYRRIFL